MRYNTSREAEDWGRRRNCVNITKNMRICRECAPSALASFCSLITGAPDKLKALSVHVLRDLGLVRSHLWCSRQGETDFSSVEDPPNHHDVQTKETVVPPCS